MAIAKTEKIWMNGRWVAWDDAKIHILAHVAHYGSSVFEGIRAYDTPEGPAVFRLEEHVDRLMFSAKVYRMEVPFSRDQIRDVILEVVAVNKLSECYIRPLIYRGYGTMGVNPLQSPVEVMVAAYPWGQYLGPEALTKGVAVKVSTWHRLAPNTLPAMAKAGANYMNSQLIKMEALLENYEEGIALDSEGFVSEGSAANVFAVIRGELFTTPLHNSILAGITRDCVITLARDMGYAVSEKSMPREMLYLADELFFTGTAVEVSPIGSVDRLPVGNGGRGPITKALQDAFFDVVHGKNPKYRHWLAPVRTAAAAGARAT